MKLVTVGLIATGLSAWLATSGGGGDGDAPDRGPEAAPAEPGQLAEADDESDEMQPDLPPLPRPRRRWGMDDRPERGRFGGPLGRRGTGPGFRRPGAGAEGEPMSPEQVKRLMAFTQQHFPDLHRRLAPLRKSNPAMFRKMLQRARGPIFDIMWIMEQHPKAAKRMIQVLRTEMELAELQKRYRAASEDERASIKTRMRKQLEKLFDLRLERLRWEIQEFEKRLESRKRELAESESDKQRIIDDELKRMLAGRPDARPGPHGPRMRKRDRPGPRLPQPEL